MSRRSNLKVVKSIQATPRKGGKPNSSRELQRHSLLKATNHGKPWTDDEVARLVAGIQRDETSFEMALAVGRSYYSTMSARGHIRFALNHSTAIETAVRQEARKAKRR